MIGYGAADRLAPGKCLCQRDVTAMSSVLDWGLRAVVARPQIPVLWFDLRYNRPDMART